MSDNLSLEFKKSKQLLCVSITLSSIQCFKVPKSGHRGFQLVFLGGEGGIIGNRRNGEGVSQASVYKCPISFIQQFPFLHPGLVLNKTMVKYEVYCISLHSTNYKVTKSLLILCACVSVWVSDIYYKWISSLTTDTSAIILFFCKYR